MKCVGIPKGDLIVTMKVFSPFSSFIIVVQGAKKLLGSKRKLKVIRIKQLINIIGFRISLCFDFQHANVSFF